MVDPFAEYTQVYRTTVAGGESLRAAVADALVPVSGDGRERVLATLDGVVDWDDLQALVGETTDTPGNAGYVSFEYGRHLVVVSLGGTLRVYRT